MGQLKKGAVGLSRTAVPARVKHNTLRLPPLSLKTHLPTAVGQTDTDDIEQGLKVKRSDPASKEHFRSILPLHLISVKQIKKTL